MCKVIIGILVMVAGLMSFQGVSAAEMCKPADNCYDSCKGLPSGYLGAGNPNNYKYENCLQYCQIGEGATLHDRQQAEYFACIKRTRDEETRLSQEKQKQQQEEQKRLEEQKKKDATANETGGAIGQPVKDLKKDLETPGATLPLQGPIQDTDAPKTQGEVVDVEYIQAGRDLKKGQVFTAPAGKPASIEILDGRINVQEGSSLKYTADDLWEAVKGKFRFIMDKLKKRKFKVTSSNAVAGVRGTQFLMDVDAQGVTTIKVLKGAIELTDKSGKKKVEVKEGFQASVSKNGPSKPARFNVAGLELWYAQTPPSPEFLEDSWKSTSSANVYREDCSTTAGLATPTQELSSDEKSALQVLNGALEKVRVKESHVIDASAKKIMISREKTDTTGKRSVTFYVQGSKVYYPDKKPNTWKSFSDPKLSSAIFVTAREENLTHQIEKSSLKFEQWSGATIRQAVYKGIFTDASTKDFIQSMFGASAEEGQAPAQSTSYFDEESNLMQKHDIALSVKSGKVAFPLMTSCTVTYAGGVIIKPPTKAKNVAPKLGAEELGNAAVSVQ